MRLHSIYFHNWFYLEENAANDIIQKFTGINEKYERLISHYKDYYVFIDFNKIMSYLTDILNIIIQLHRKRNNWAEIKICESIIYRIRFINYQIESYGHNSKYRKLGSPGFKNL